MQIYLHLLVFVNYLGSRAMFELEALVWEFGTSWRIVLIKVFVKCCRSAN